MSDQRNPSRLASFAVTVLLALLCSTVARAGNTNELPFDMPSFNELQSSDRMVFAHYFTPFYYNEHNDYPDSTWAMWTNPYANNGYNEHGGRVRQTPLPRAPLPAGVDYRIDDMMHQVRQAEAAGIDGWTLYLASAPGMGSENWTQALRMAEAIEAGSDHFKIMLHLDMSSYGPAAPYSGSNEAANISNFVSSIEYMINHHSSSLYYLDDGRLVISPYFAEAKPPEWYKARFDTIKADTGVTVAFAPVFNSASGNMVTFANNSTLADSGYYYGAGAWGGRVPTGSGGLTGQSSLMDSAEANGLIYFNVVAPDSVRSKSNYYDESENTTTYRNAWMNTIQGGSDGEGAQWAHIITWSDYGEGTELEPGTAKTHAYLDLTAYFSSWFKTGEQPRIVRDAFYGIYRTESLDAVPDPNAQQAGEFHLNDGVADYNKIEMLAFLTEEATLKVEINGQVYTHLVTNAEIANGGGLFSYTVPLDQGTPTFTILRDNEVVAEQTGWWEVNDDILVENLLYHAQSSLRINPTENIYALSDAYRWGTQDGNIKVRIQEDRSPFVRLSNEVPVKYTDDSTAGGGQAGLGYSFLPPDGNAAHSIAFDFAVLDDGDGTFDPLAKLEGPNKDGPVLKLFADDGNGGHVLALQLPNDSFVLLDDMAVEVGKWYRLIFNIDPVNQVFPDTFDLIFTSEDGASVLRENLQFHENVNSLLQLLILNNASNAGIGSIAIDNVYVGDLTPPIPEPATAAITLIGALLYRRPRRESEYVS